MPRQALESVIGRAILNEGFRLAFFADPDAALAGYDFAEAESGTLKTIDAESLDAFAERSEQRILKLLAIPDQGE